MSAAAEQQEGEPGSSDLVSALAELARRMQQQEDSEATLEKVVEAAIALVPGAEEGSISVVTDRKKVQSWAASNDLPREVDELQGEVGEGPCLDAVFEQDVVSVPDMAGEQRWPRFAARAAEAGAASMLSFQLFIDAGDLGAMNLYSREPHAFDEESQRVGLPLAAHAAVALARVQEREQLLTAMNSRDLIGQAQGILMERHKITADQAFQLLARASQDRNVKLRDLAEELIFSGELQAPAPKRRDRS